ncbi:probable tubulin polyglutamylase ttll-15 [Amphiura filiformis]|uniref:probable tubulin polyglutamylase ttll-15 n=1 Tax=Amphiura filiformis TaxID=82378 RepID=UPI003B221B40
MKHLLQKRYCRGQMVTSYITDAGHNVSEIHTQIYDAIRSVVYSRKDIIQHILQEKYGSMPSHSCNFFEFTRWDFILGADMKVYLLEANLSPDMSSKGPGHDRTMRNERHLYNVIRTLGADRKSGHANSWLRNSDVLVSAAICYKPMCASCTSEECFLCGHCLTEDHVTILKESFGEHLNRQGMRRLHPMPMTQEESTVKRQQPRTGYMSKLEQLNQVWFQEKCKQNAYWCT